MPRVYIHGLGQTPDSWEKVAAQLDTPAESICPSLPEILREREATYDNLYAAFADICDKVRGPLDLCGLSLGGVLALNYAVDHPQNVRSLALIAAQYQMPKRLLRFQNVLFRFMPGPVFDQMGFGKKDFIRLCKSMMELDFSGSLRQVSCPVLVVCGEKDAANKAASKNLADILPDAELRVISGAGHEVNVEAPEKLAAALQEFGWAANAEPTQ